LDRFNGSLFQLVTGSTDLEPVRCRDQAPAAHENTGITSTPGTLTTRNTQSGGRSLRTFTGF
jgi:hypothetical protein